MRTMSGKIVHPAKVRIRAREMLLDGAPWQVIVDECEVSRSYVFRLAKSLRPAPAPTQIEQADTPRQIALANLNVVFARFEREPNRETYAALLVAREQYEEVNIG